MNRRTFLQTGSTAATGFIATGALSGTAAAHYGSAMIDTRDHFNDSCELINGETATSYDTDGTVPCIDESCVDDLTVMVHGWNNTHSDAVAKTDDCAHSLYDNGYGGEVVGFSWDSDKGGWEDAKCIAQENGPKLGQFLLDYKYYGSGTLRVVTHSLGVQVLFSALRWLDSNDTWDYYGYEVTSTHLLGAAQDNESPTKEWLDTYYAIRNETTTTFNYWNQEDDTLEYYFNTYEFDQALGETGKESGNEAPCNYTDYDATSQVGNCHSCYLEPLGDEMVYHMNHVADYSC